MKNTRKRGFSLIEAAIVLGLVGLVIGGIWAAAATIAQQRRFNNVREFYLAAFHSVKEIRRNITGSTYQDITSVVAGRVKSGGFVLNGGLLKGNGVSIGIWLNDTAMDTLIFFHENMSVPKTDQKLCINIAKWLSRTDWSGTTGFVLWSDTNGDILTMQSMGPGMAVSDGWCGSAANLEIAQPL